jgi:hypothetical protein
VALVSFEPLWHTPRALLSLIFLNQSIASLGHAGARCFIRRSSVKIGVAKGYVSLTLLK